MMATQQWEHLTFTAAYSGSDFLGVVKMYDDQELPDWKNKKWYVYHALKQLGEQGWELITVMWRKTGETTYADSTYYFKRPKEV